MTLGIPVDDLSLLGSPPTRPPDAARWWVLRSRLADVRGKDDEVLENLRNAVRVDPRNAEAHFRLGQAMIRRGDREGCQAYLDRALALGLCQDNLKRELRRLLRERIDVQALLRLGQLCQESGMNAESIDWYQLAYQRDLRLRPP
jgi:tetratricopeptide (TPR) repeat protein